MARDLHLESAGLQPQQRLKSSPPRRRFKHLRLGSAPQAKPKPKPEPEEIPASQSTPATIPPGTIRGLGTEDDPLLPPVRYNATGEMRKNAKWTPVQCTISTCGLWYIRSYPSQKRCHKCRQSGLGADAQRHYFTPKEVTKLEVKAAETWAEFRARLKTFGLNSIPEDADRRKIRNFGVYGDIMCTWREMAAARLLANGEIVILVADGVGLPAAAIFDMLDGVGGQPRFNDMRAHYENSDGGLQLLQERQRLTRLVREASGLTPNQRVTAALSLSKLWTDIREAQPPTPKVKEINFGESLEQQGIRNIAKGQAYDYSLLCAGNAETGAQGGPGPRK